jgi:sodium/potassium-transporting ATPase subunit alpha
MLTELLDASRILVLRGLDRAAVFAACLARLDDDDARAACGAALGKYPDLPFGSLHHEILIPHVRVPALRKAEAVLAVLPEGLEPAERPFRLVLLLATPERDAALHLRLLQGVSALLPAIEDALVAAESPEAAHAVVARGEAATKPSYKNLTARQVGFELQTDLYAGLDAPEAARRLAHFGPNRIERAARVSLLARLLGSFFSFFAVLLWVAAGLCFVPGVDMPQLGWAILLVVGINGAVSFLQEARSDRAVDALQRLLALQCRVVRGGQEHTMPADALVPGDVVLLDEGDAVPADCRLIEAAEVEVDDSALTGESRASRRYKSDREVLLHGRFLFIELPNILFAGTTLLRGRARAVVFGTGMSTEIGRIAALTARIAPAVSPLKRQLRATVFSIAALASLLAFTFLLIGWRVAHLSFAQAFVFCIGIFVANVPEGLLPTVTLALAVGVSRMAKRGALVKDLESVETLGCTTVICSDKTGTLTQNLATVVALCTAGTDGAVVTVRGDGHAPTADFFRDGAPVSPAALAADRAVQALLACALHCNNARVERDGARTTLVGDPTEAALLVLAERAGFTAAATRLHLCPFESVRKRMSVVVADDTGAPTVWAKGSPADLLACCAWMLRDGTVVPLTDALRAEALAAADAFAEEGHRVLGFARRAPDSLAREARAEWCADTVERDLVWLGLTAMADPLRPSVAPAVAACHTAGIRVLMITGDHPLTARSVGRAIGLGAERVLTGAEVESMDDAALAASLRAGEPLFARVSPEQKLRIVGCLRDLGEVVAVTGDGVNDGPALKRADIGIAMGQRGTDVAKEAARMILTDDDFGTIVAAIEEGRGVFANIRRFAAYVLNSNPQEVLPFVLWALFPGFPLVMTVMGVLAVDVGTDLVPAAGLGVEPPEPGLMRRPPRRRDTRLLSIGFILRAYLVQGSILCAACFATWWFYVQTCAGGVIPRSPPGLDMRLASPAYLQSLTAFFFPTVAVQMANVMCKRSEETSLFALDFLPPPRRAQLLAAVARWAVVGPAASAVFTRLPRMFNLLSNPLIVGGIAFALLLVYLFVHTGLRRVFWFEPVPWSVYLFAFHGTAVLLAFEEGRKYLLRRARRRAGATPSAR